MFATAGGIKAPRSQASVWTAIILHALILALIAYFVVHQVVKVIPPQPQVATAERVRRSTGPSRQRFERRMRSPP